MRKFKNTPKKVYKKSQPQQLPRNSRFIPEIKLTDDLVFFVGIVCILSAILVISANLYLNIRQEKTLISQKVKLTHDLDYWQDASQKYPNFRDAYFGLAITSFQLGDFNKASQDLTKALNLDPNFTQALQLQEELNKK